MSIWYVNTSIDQEFVTLAYEDILLSLTHYLARPTRLAHSLILTGYNLCLDVTPDPN